MTKIKEKMKNSEKKVKKSIKYVENQKNFLKIMNKLSKNKVEKI